MWYIPRAYLFHNWKFVPFDSLHPFHHPLPSLPQHPTPFPAPPMTTNIFSVSEFGVCFVLDFTEKWIILYLSFTVLLIRRMLIHVVAKSRISFLHDWIAFHYIYAYTVISLSIHLSWTLRMSPLSWLLWLILQWTWRCRLPFQVSVFLF